ncbi:MAG: epoxyqueuosine reductase QueH [Candidatus Aureabacteria bacterium]|nr:epoxyqueuosine reductase QueH [Candidatus Auribacterota bacterium]
MSRPRLLLHICCAPCSTHVLNLLLRDFQVTAYFFNPNIHPPREYRRRLLDAERHCGAMDVPVHPAAYRPHDWFSAAGGLAREPEGGARCARCFLFRLEETTRMAGVMDCGWCATTLSVSPHKDAALINRTGVEAAARHGVRFHEADFKKGGGYAESCRISREQGLYRQRYCGCIYSMIARHTPTPFS